MMKPFSSAKFLLLLCALSAGGSAPLQTRWEPDLLGGVVVITGEWQDGSKCVAVPNYVRMNRQGPPPAYPPERIIDTGAVASRSRPQEAQSVSKVLL